MCIRDSVRCEHICDPITIHKHIDMAQVYENSTIELHDLNSQQPDQAPSHVPTTGEPTIATSLPPADGGLAAWRLLIAAFVFEALLWGRLSLSTSQFLQFDANRERRLPTLLRRLPSTLLDPAPFQRLAIHRHRRHNSFRNVVPRRAHHHTVY